MSDRENPRSKATNAAHRRDFPSILFDRSDGHPLAVQPECFRDLNLDQIVDAVVRGRDEYDLRPLFHGPPLADARAVRYRHGAFRELESEVVLAAARKFAEGMRAMRRLLELARRQPYRLEKQRWFLDAAVAHRDCVSGLAAELEKVELRSRAFRALRNALSEYVRGDRFAALARELDAVRGGLERVRYSLRIKGDRVTVGMSDGVEEDYSAEIEQIFRRFRQGAVDQHRPKLSDPGAMDHVEARIAELVARLYPHEFDALDRFWRHRCDIPDARLVRLDREIQFYLAYLEYIAPIASSGLSFSLPKVSDLEKATAVEGAFDLALAARCIGDGRCVVTNDLHLDGAERILIVTGPNQGGKTTFARAFGQLHHLAALGLPVPAARAKLFLGDAVLTHFERAESVASLRGKLDDELVRMREVLERATAGTVLVVNEVFASTSLPDATLLAGEVLHRIVDLDCLAVCVTFIDELAALGPETVSMVATVEPDDPSRRTFRIERRPADGRAYASALAGKHGLSAEAIQRRVRR